MFNKCIQVGNLTEDPTLRYTGDSKPVCNFRIAVNEKYGEKETVLFIGVVVWGRQAEACGQYLKKGSQALVEGKLVENSWEHEGRKHSKIEIVANNVRFLSKSEAPASAPDEITDIEPF